ncbi:hypothetical protein BCR42DRAFT_416082 [Absidia repens]|uniref:MYND-type domain-containing protein n=1 Tax=Absidia repens TaxID=90262 RepID=A0A1X2IG48_9FUNG|nr:hypothetical protein BCR42DRAFT_416082 [Absidia repens]
MPPITILTTPQEQTFDINEKEGDACSTTSPLNMNTPLPPLQNDIDDDDMLITLDEAGLHRVWLSSEHILLHLDDLTAVESVCRDLWDIGKQLKHDHNTDNNDDNVYRKAMLWMIYHCRGSIAYRQQEWTKAIHACQTCLAIDLSAPPPSLSDSLLLQKVGLIQAQAQTSSMLEHCLTYQLQQKQQRRRSSSLTGSTISDSSSDASTGLVMMVCSFCAVKKRTMPVCAQCKSQRYCGMKCLKLDKDRHSSLCCLQR